MTVFAGEVKGERRRICCVASSFNGRVTEALVAGAQECLVSHGVRPEDIDVLWVPGAWELPQGVRLALARGGYDGIVALGCVIRGETPHFEYISMGATVGLEAAGRNAAVPVAFGLLTTENSQQALARAGGAKGNKGAEAARAVLEMCGLVDTVG